MTDFQVDLNQLRAAASAWRDASSALDDAAIQAQNIRDGHKDILWFIFQEAWDAQVAAAQYMHDRLNEGRDEAYSIGSVLNHVSNVYLEKDQNFANSLIKLDGGS